MIKKIIDTESMQKYKNIMRHKMLYNIEMIIRHYVTLFKSRPDKKSGRAGKFGRILVLPGSGRT